MCYAIYQCRGEGGHGARKRHMAYALLLTPTRALIRFARSSHSVTNSMRRPATILAALLYQPIGLTPLNYAGIVIACGGSLVYGLV